MSISVEEICNYIESWAPSSWAESWDNIGLQLGSKRKKVSRVGLVLELVPEVVPWTRLHSIELLVTHHPVIFTPLKKLDEDDPYTRLLVSLLRLEVSVVSYHTNLDVAPDGVTEVFLKALGVSCERPIKCVSSEDPRAGVGRIGSLKSPVRLSELADRVSKLLGVEVEVVGEDRVVEKVAACAGSGADLISEVLKLGADVYITGDVKHHAARFAELHGLPLLIADHFATEEFFLPHLKEKISSRFPELEVLVFKGKSPFTKKQLKED